MTVTVVAGTEETLFNVQGEARQAGREVKERFPTSTKRVQSLTHDPHQDFHFLRPHHTPEWRKYNEHIGTFSSNQNSQTNVQWRASNKLANPWYSRYSL